jgi:hypothetical protein
MIISEENINKAIALSSNGYSVRQIADEIGCGKSTIARWLNESKDKPDTMPIHFDKDSFPMTETDKAILGLVRTLQHNSFMLNGTFYRDTFKVFIELLQNLTNGLDDEDQTYYPVERDVLKQLYDVYKQNDFPTEIKDRTLIKDINDLKDYYQA